MKFEWRLPVLEVEPMVYGEYLVKHPDMIPAQDVSLDTKGYIVTGVEYGSAEETQLPFKVNDWIDEEYVKSNFKEL